MGQAFVEILPTRLDLLRRNYLVEPKVVAIADSSGAAINPGGLDLGLAIKTKRQKGKIALYPKFGRSDISGVEVLDQVDADVAIEVTPTNVIDAEPGLSHMLKAIEMGDHLVTSNKGPFALAFSKIVDAAEKQGVELRYNGTVGGATPIVSLAKRCLAGNTVLSVRGVLNATTNYILTRMTKEDLTLERALASAQSLGIAETDPTYDIDGIDTACKIVILANAIMNRKVSYRDVEEITGISGIKREEVEEAKEKGFAIKLIGTVGDEALRVRPERVAFTSPLCVDEMLNSVILETDLAKEITIIGRGAGPTETASTILNDLIDVIRTAMVRR